MNLVNKYFCVNCDVNRRRGWRSTILMFFFALVIMPLIQNVSLAGPLAIVTLNTGHTSSFLPPYEILPGVGCRGECFVNGSTDGAANSRSCDFGDGSPIITVGAGVEGAFLTGNYSFGHTYANPGTYTVTVSAVAADFSTSVSKSTQVVYTGQVPPISSLSIYPDRNGWPACATITFNIASVGGCDTWKTLLDASDFTTVDFGDGNSYHWSGKDDALAIAVLRGTLRYSYVHPGTYTVTLTTSDGFSTVTATCQVLVTPPLNIQGVSASLQTFNYIPSTYLVHATICDLIYFSGYATESCNRSITYSWDFGDGSTGSGLDTTHQYTRPGNYIVTLTVTDGTNTVSKTMQAIVTFGLAVSAINGSANPGTICNPITLAANAVDCKPITNYKWDFGDGTPVISSSSSTSPSHTYMHPDTYDASVTVSDGVYQASKSYHQVITQGFQIYSASASPSPATAKSNITFTTSVQNCTHNPTTYTWDFGDGTAPQTKTDSANTASVTHQYDTPNTYTVTATAANSGLTDTKTFSLVVQPQKFAVTASPNSLNIGQGGSRKTTITVAANIGFDDAVALSISGQPSGVTGEFDPTSVTPGSGASATSQLKIKVAADVPVGTYPITVTGTSGTITNTTTVTLIVSEVSFLPVRVKDHVIEADSILELSAPAPVIHVTDRSFTLTSDASSDVISGTIHIQGTVSSGICDLTSGAQGIIDHLDVFLDDQTTPFAVISAENGDFSVSKNASDGFTEHPYPYTGTFDATLTLTNIDAYAHIVSVVAEEPIYHNEGKYKFQIDVEPLDDSEDHIDEEDPMDDDSANPTTWKALPVITKSEESQDNTRVLVTRLDTGDDTNNANFDDPDYRVLYNDEERKVIKWPDLTDTGHSYYIADETGLQPELFIAVGTSTLPPGSDVGDDSEAASIQRSLLSPGLNAAVAGCPESWPQFWRGFVESGLDAGVQTLQTSHDLQIVTNPGAFYGDYLASHIPRDGIIGTYHDMYNDAVSATYQYFDKPHQLWSHRQEIGVAWQTTQILAKTLYKLYGSNVTHAVKVSLYTGLIAGDPGAVGPLDEDGKRCVQMASILIHELGTKFYAMCPYERGKATGVLVQNIIPFLIPGVGPEVGGAKVIASLPEAEYLTEVVAKVEAPSSGLGITAADIPETLEFIRLCQSPGCCFVAGTQVLTNHGLKPIEKIRKDDQVLSRDPKTGWQQYKRVLGTFVTHPSVLYRVNYSVRRPRMRSSHKRQSSVKQEQANSNDDSDPHSISGELTCTAEHPFWVINKHAFITARGLEVGDQLLLASGAKAIVSKISHKQATVGQAFVTYNLNVADFHTYFAGNSSVWVHNQGPPCPEAEEIYLLLRHELGMSPDEAMERMLKIAEEMKGLPKLGGENLSDLIKLFDDEVWKQAAGSPPYTHIDLTKLETCKRLYKLFEKGRLGNFKKANNPSGYAVLQRVHHIWCIYIQGALDCFPRSMSNKFARLHPGAAPEGSEVDFTLGTMLTNDEHTEQAWSIHKILKRWLPEDGTILTWDKQDIVDAVFRAYKERAEYPGHEDPMWMVKCRAGFQELRARHPDIPLPSPAAYSGPPL